MDDDPLQHWSLLWFLAIAVFYTGLAFAFISRFGGKVFSERNAIPPSRVLTVHLQFLTLLLVVMWIGTALYPSLPIGMTDAWIKARGSSYSDVDVLLLVIMAAMGVVERRRIYLERDTDSEVKL